MVSSYSSIVQMHYPCGVILTVHYLLFIPTTEEGKLVLFIIDVSMIALHACIFTHSANDSSMCPKSPWDSSEFDLSARSAIGFRAYSLESMGLASVHLS